MSLTYFGLDGNYGDAAGLVVVDTSVFTADDFDLIDEARDEERGFAALEIAQSYTRNN